MMIIGLTGGIGSGKSTVANMLTKAGIPVIDADKIAHELTKKNNPILQEIIKEFGEDILDEHHELNRRKLGALVFNNPQLLKKLENIIHPKIEEIRRKKTKKLVQEGHEIIVYMAPLLFEKNIHQHLSKTILVIADQEIIKNRLQKRDKLSAHEIEQRVKAQMSAHQKSSLADEIIENNGTVAELHNQLAFVWHKLTGQKLAN